MQGQLGNEYPPTDGHSKDRGEMSEDRPRRRRVASVSLEPVEAQWADSLVDTLRAVGYRHVSRSEVVNVALAILRETLNNRTPYEVLRVFLDRARRD
jgi:hypothetical protein